MAPSRRKNSDATVTVTDAADRLGLSPSTVRAYCREPQMLGRKRFGTKHTDAFGRTGYLLTEDEVDWLSDPANRPLMGRPREDRKMPA